MKLKIVPAEAIENRLFSKVVQWIFSKSAQWTVGRALFILKGVACFRLKVLELHSPTVLSRYVLGSVT